MSAPPPAESSGFLLPPAPIERIADFLAAGGGRGLQRALEVGAVATIETIAAAGLRGRGVLASRPGGSGSRYAMPGPGRRFVVVNAAEGEPATFKDRMLMRRDPYRIVEGAAIAAFAVGADAIYLATKRSFGREVERSAPRRRRAQRAGPAPGARRQHRRGARRLPLRRGEGAARGHRGSRPAAATAAALRARPLRDRLADRLGGGSRPVGGAIPSRTRPSSTTPRRSPRRRTSWPTAPSGSARWAPPSLRAR